MIESLFSNLYVEIRHELLSKDLYCEGSLNKGEAFRRQIINIPFVIVEWQSVEVCSLWVNENKFIIRSEQSGDWFVLDLQDPEDFTVERVVDIILFFNYHLVQTDESSKNTQKTESDLINFKNSVSIGVT